MNTKVKLYRYWHTGTDKWEAAGVQQIASNPRCLNVWYERNGVRTVALCLLTTEYTFNATELFKSMKPMSYDALTIISGLISVYIASVKPPITAKNSIRSAADELPGVRSVVQHPVKGISMSLMTAIINLNDEYQWTREKISDWLETLDIDMRFK